MPVQFLEQLFSTLRRAGLLPAIAGSRAATRWRGPPRRSPCSRSSRRSTARWERRARRPVGSGPRESTPCATSSARHDRRHRPPRGRGGRRGDVLHLMAGSTGGVANRRRGLLGGGQHAARRAAPSRRGAGRRGLREARVDEPGRLGEGPHRARHDRRRRGGRAGAGPSVSWSRPGATPGSRWRSSARRAATADPHDARDHEPGAPRRCCGRTGPSPLAAGADGMHGAVDKAEEIGEERRRFMPQQFQNPANPEVHRRTTAEEIWRTPRARSTFSSRGSARGARSPAWPGLRGAPPRLLVAVEPTASPVLSGGPPGPTRSRASAPASCRACSTRTLLRGHHLSADDASLARRLAQEEGILVGISAGANMWAALEVARRPTARARPSSRSSATRASATCRSLFAP